jgi:hypothetical protein
MTYYDNETVSNQMKDVFKREWESAGADSESVVVIR